MILITKPAHAHSALKKGEALVRAHEAARVADPAEGASRQRAFKFDKSIYGAAAIKRALRTAQHDKCCYCEGIFSGQASGDVEHFRPKACVQQENGGPVEYPGYYWLAYTWSNLYYACELCNRVGKRNLFPLTDPSRRLRSGADIGSETPEILDPGGPNDPRDHIRFNGAAPEGITRIGKTTIRALGLDRGDLTTDRLRHLKLVDALRHLANLEPEGLDDATLIKCRAATEELARLAGSQAIYSAMTQDYLAH